MPQDNDAWARYRKKEAERAAAAKKKKREEADPQSVLDRARQEAGHTAKETLRHDDLNAWVEQIPILIEQLNHLYVMYFQGIEKRPPIERRKVLVNLMYKIQNASKSSTVVRFRAQTLVGQIQTQLERWDKQLRAREKIKKAA